MKAKVALFTYPEYVNDEVPIVQLVFKDEKPQFGNYVQLTELVEVEFPRLPLETSVADALESLRESRKSELARHLTTMKEIEDTANKLLALTHQSGG